MSNYFSYFPLTDHDLTNNGQSVKLTNLLRRFKIQNSAADRSDIFYTYDIQEGDRPDTIADKYYGDSSYAWVVMLYNNIYDVNFDWPLDYVDFESYIAGKYGTAAVAQASVKEYRIYLSKVVDGVKVPAKSDVSFDGNVLQERVVVVDETTYNATPSEYRKAAVSDYAYEVELNEKRRQIKILDARHLSQLRDEVEDILRNGV